MAQLRIRLATPPPPPRFPSPSRSPMPPRSPPSSSHMPSLYPPSRSHMPPRSPPSRSHMPPRSPPSRSHMPPRSPSPPWSPALLRSPSPPRSPSAAVSCFELKKVESLDSSSNRAEVVSKVLHQNIVKKSVVETKNGFGKDEGEGKRDESEVKGKMGEKRDGTEESGEGEDNGVGGEEDNEGNECGGQGWTGEEEKADGEGEAETIGYLIVYRVTNDALNHKIGTINGGLYKSIGYLNNAIWDFVEKYGELPKYPTPGVFEYKYEYCYMEAENIVRLSFPEAQIAAEKGTLDFEEFFEMYRFVFANDRTEEDYLEIQETEKKVRNMDASKFET